jgi:transcriptional regulator with PAS, ATPase and Fis domain
VREIEPSAFHALCLYTWPRNVRELAKVIAEAVALGEGAPTLKLSHLPDAITAIIDRPTAAATTTASHPARRSSPTRAELEALLRQHHGNVTHVARAMGRQWAVVWRWLVKYEIDPKEYR